MIFLKMTDKQGNEVLRTLAGDVEIIAKLDTTVDGVDGDKLIVKHPNLVTIRPIKGNNFDFTMSFKHFCEKVKAIEENK